MATGTINMPITKPVPVSEGGTGATNADEAIANLNILSAKYAGSIVANINGGRATVPLSEVGLSSVPVAAIAACTSSTYQCWYLFDESLNAGALKFAFANAGSSSLISTGTVRFTFITF